MMHGTDIMNCLVQGTKDSDPAVAAEVINIVLQIHFCVFRTDLYHFVFRFLKRQKYTVILSGLKSGGFYSASILTRGSISMF